nr:hypothetical protein WG33_0404 [uncultured bacterium]
MAAFSAACEAPAIPAFAGSVITRIRGSVNSVSAAFVAADVEPSSQTHHSHRG